MLPRVTFATRPPRVRRFDAWAAANLFHRQRATVVVLICIAVYLVVGLLIVVLLRGAEPVCLDCAEAYAWGMQFLGGYGRHPPLTGWIAGVWYRVFPAADWSSYALSRVMTGISLVSIYFIAVHAVGTRRAMLVTFAMMLYPLFVAGKAGDFDNYQVLLAMLPLTVWMFLRAYQKPTALAGIALGAAAAASMLTIYSAVLGLAAIGLAAVLHPGRRNFFVHPAPYLAVMTFITLISPHAIWLVQKSYPSIRWASSSVNNSAQSNAGMFLGHHLALLAFCFAAFAIALWPWRSQAKSKLARFVGARRLVVPLAVLIGAGPLLVSLALKTKLNLGWGNPFYCLLPLATLALLPNLLVTRLSVVRAAVTAGIYTSILLLSAPVYSWARAKLEPQDSRYRNFPLAATEITRLWHERFHSPFRLVVSQFNLADQIVFYSPDHPKMYADFDPAYSPWIDYPIELEKEGYVGLCFADNGHCRLALNALSPHAEQIDIEIQRPMYGLMTPPMTLHLEFTGPGIGVAR